MLAKWFHMQPSEMERMDIADFAQWVRLAEYQMEKENG